MESMKGSSPNSPNIKLNLSKSLWCNFWLGKINTEHSHHNDFKSSLSWDFISLDISIPVTLAPRFEIDCDRSIFNIIVLSKDKIIM